MSDNLSSIGMTFGEAADIVLKRLKTNLRLKPRTKAKCRERIRATRKSWEGIDDLNVRRIRPTQCQQWAKRFQKEVDAEIFNETLAVMISIFTMAEGLGLRMKNPTTGVEPLPIEKPKPEPPKPNLKLPKRVRLRLKKATSEH
jgi:hypothetical protein